MDSIKKELKLGSKYSCTELWYLAENGKIPNEAVFEDQEDNQIVFSDKSFQIYYSDKDESEYYIGMCVGDQWEYIGIDEE